MLRGASRAILDDDRLGRTPDKELLFEIKTSSQCNRRCGHCPHHEFDRHSENEFRGNFARQSRIAEFIEARFPVNRRRSLPVFALANSSAAPGRSGSGSGPYSGA